MLSLTAQAIHLNGRHSDVTGQFGAAGGSLGRDAQCDLVLPDPDRQISRLQARIIYTEGQYIVRNTSTSNPMYVNGVELSPGSSQPLDSGDELRAGSYVITVAKSADAEQAPNTSSIGAAPLKAPNTAELPAPVPQAGSGLKVDPSRVPSANGAAESTGSHPLADLSSGADPIGKDDIEAASSLEDRNRPASSAAKGLVPWQLPGKSAEQTPAARSQSQESIDPHVPNPPAGIAPPAQDNDSLEDTFTPIPHRGPTAVASCGLSVNAPLQSRHNLDPHIGRSVSPGFEPIYPIPRDPAATHER